MRLKVVIIGCGALGKCLAAILMNAADVIVYDRDTTVRRDLSRKGFVFKEKSRKRKVRIKVAPSLPSLRSEEINLLIFATKVMDLKAAVIEAAGLDPDYVFLPQNGIFGFDWIKRSFKTAKICRGVTTMACQETAYDQATLFYRGDFYIGGAGAPFVEGLFRKAGVNVKAYKDPVGAVWAKLIFSAVMNPLPVMTAQGYDVLKKDPKVWDLVRQAISEGRMVAKALKVRLAFDPLELILRVRDGDLAGILHRGSIAQDILAGRPTEVDFITGALIRQASKLGMRTPALREIMEKAKKAGA